MARFFRSLRPKVNVVAPLAIRDCVNMHPSLGLTLLEESASFPSAEVLLCKIPPVILAAFHCAPRHGCLVGGLKMAVIARTVSSWVITSEKGSGESLRQCQDGNPVLRLSSERPADRRSGRGISKARRYLLRRSVSLLVGGFPKRG